ncbi:MAG: NAD(P)-dependent oxidoreductase [Candidatus Helarchaeota archaeon]|nr:NAD(P)-dependent oxidoreductase [Candidatus Helarchaeota archaeon]
MKVLLTGAFGNIGESALKALLQQEHEILCFDLETKQNKKTMKKVSKLGTFQTRWGDICDPETVSEITDGRECILHLAAIIPPMSEKKPDLARKVNVGGMKNIINAAKKQKYQPKFILTSSISMYGPRKPGLPPLRADDPLNPTDNYTHHKVECEDLLKNSGLPWTILRLGACPPQKLQTEGLDILFEIPLEQRVEFVHTRDVGQALANAVTANTNHKILLIGGGKSCQMLNREFTKTMLEANSIGMFPESAFKVPKDANDWYYIDWMDTTEAQELLHFQNLTIEDHFADVRKNLGWKRYFFKLMSRIIRWYMLKKSAYYKKKN